LKVLSFLFELFEEMILFRLDFSYSDLRGLTLACENSISLGTIEVDLGLKVYYLLMFCHQFVLWEHLVIIHKKIISKKSALSSTVLFFISQISHLFIKLRVFVLKL